MAHPLLAQQSHRPWVTPSQPWLMEQTWHDLLFMHWALPPETIRALLPAGLTLDTFDGKAWVGVVPFHMSGIRARGLPMLPPFAELNVRTYVTIDGKPGVWFFSLDAANRLAVEGARQFYHLPYFNAAMQVELKGDTVHYSSRRTDQRIRAGEFRAQYRPTGAIYQSKTGSLDAWLTERYCLYAANGSKLYRGEIQHVPWSLQPAEAEIKINTVTQAHGIILSDEPPLLHYVKRLDILAWWLERVL